MRSTPPSARCGGFEDGPLDTEEAQITFVSALTAAAFSLSATGGLDYAWASFEDVFHERQVLQRQEEVTPCLSRSVQ